MKKLFGRLFVSILSVALLVLFFVIFFITIFYIRSSRQWANSSFDEFSHRFAVCLSETNKPIDLRSIVGVSLNCAEEDNRISGLLFRNEEGEVVYSLGKTQMGEMLSQRERPMIMDIPNPGLEVGVFDEHSYQFVVTNSPVTLVQTMNINNQLLVDLIRVSDNNSVFEKREIEVPMGVEPSSITGSIIIMDGDEFSYAIDVLVFSPATYKYSKDIFSVGSIWIISIILIALQFSLVLSYYFSKQLENYAKGLRKALFQLSKGEENVELPKYKVEEYEEINEAVKLLDQDLSQNRQNRKAWLRNITHDLNTPVTSMQILLDGIEDKIFPLNNDTISMLKKEHSDLSARIQRVVLYASLQSPDKQITISHCSTKEIISAIEKRKLDFSRVKFVELDDEVIADYTLIVMAIISLIENAIEYGEKDVIVEISKNKVTVINKGNLEIDDAIFEPWERGDKSRSKGGNGLGLPIAYEIMRLHNGTININQEDDNVIAKLTW
ncbi:MAG: sensor histidine kinase [Pleomorphochaeta sp.]